jgi:nitrous oxide reductase accessory protein NosL
VVAPGVKSPMGSNAAAFLNKESAQKFLTNQNGQLISWSEILKRAE